ncbi:hypothetical protein H5410_058061 [Solanum commersonii]|uniref:Uncharacterized protein n=1 Tax=Solanum commersonii TaxID=4109 RepID=A0A9J5WRR3_SOLCO|nr:hypothetical protein H5410_058061 [Solanum commersonii]
MQGLAEARVDTALTSNGLFIQSRISDKPSKKELLIRQGWSKYHNLLLNQFLHIGWGNLPGCEIAAASSSLNLECVDMLQLCLAE